VSLQGDVLYTHTTIAGITGFHLEISPLRTTEPADQRIDPYLGTVVHVVGARQARPNLPSTGCPFCVGGLEAPDPYEVRWFTNRWPAMHGDRCEVVLYTPHHDATLPSLGVPGVRKVIDLWADRTTALGLRDDVEFVLVFENRGPEVGATIAHPHGQIYAYDHVPQRPASLLTAGWKPEADCGERFVAASDGGPDHDARWTACVPAASTFPIAVTLAPTEQVPDLPSLDGQGRDALAALLVDVLDRLDRLHDQPLPYMMWLNQRPTDGQEWPQAWFNIEIVSPWRSAGVARFIAAAEVAGGEFFNPVIPEDLARQLRALARPAPAQAKALPRPDPALAPAPASPRHRDDATSR
jgi:UDPglucose--hexose-1-phosphate uridylyltransferase